MSFLEPKLVRTIKPNQTKEMNEEMNDWVRTKWGDIFVRARRDNRRGWEVCCGLYRANKHLIKSNQITRKYERKVSLRDKVQTTIWKLYQHYTSSVWRVHQSTSSEITQSSHCIWYRRPVNWIIFIKKSGSYKGYLFWKWKD